MATLKERTKWAITYVVKNHDLSNAKIAELLNVNGNTVGSYRNMVADPKVDFIVKFCDEFYFDIVWFTKGVGEPFQGARSQFPEICGDPIYEDIRHGRLKSGPGDEPNNNSGREELIKMTETVLSSNTEYSTSLAFDILSFYNSISEISRLQERVIELESRMRNLESSKQ